MIGSAKPQGFLRAYDEQAVSLKARWPSVRRSLARGQGEERAEEGLLAMELSLGAAGFLQVN